jgi:hypothetical protein
VILRYILMVDGTLFFEAPGFLTGEAFFDWQTAPGWLELA